MEIALALVDEFLFARGHRLTGILRGPDIERLAHLLPSRDAPFGYREAAIDHWHRDRPADHRAGFLWLRFAALVVIADFHRRQADAIGTFDIDDAAAADDIARRRDRGILQALNQLRGYQAGSFIVVHDPPPFIEPM